MTHRCEHLAPGERGTRYNAPYGVEAELCSECVAEFDARLTEVDPATRNVPLVEAAESNTGGSDGQRL